MFLLHSTLFLFLNKNELVFFSFSQQAACRQRESGSSSGELSAAGGGQPVSVHQNHVIPRIPALSCSPLTDQIQLLQS